MNYKICISKEGLSAPDLKIVKKKKDGKFKKYVAVELGFFGKDYAFYTTQQEKLSYLVTLAWVVNGCYDTEELQDSYDYSQLEQDILEYLKGYGIECEGFWIDPKSEAEAGIDHQTTSDYSSIYDFETNMSCSYTDFVFNSYITLHTQCD